MKIHPKRSIDDEFEKKYPKIKLNIILSCIKADALGLTKL